jgi:hypothetical protein
MTEPSGPRLTSYARRHDAPQQFVLGQGASTELNLDDPQDGHLVGFRLSDHDDTLCDGVSFCSL